MRILIYFQFTFVLVHLLFFIFARDYLEIRVTCLDRPIPPFFLPFPVAIQFSLTFSSCHALILSPCSVLIYCGILYFELRLRVLTRFCVDNMTVYATLYTLITISIPALSSPTMACKQTIDHGRFSRVSESRREATYRPDDNILKKRKRWARSIDFRRRKMANGNSSHSLSQMYCILRRDLTK